MKIWLPLLVIVIIARLGHGIHVRNAHALVTNVCITKSYIVILTSTMGLRVHVRYTSYSWVN